MKLIDMTCPKCGAQLKLDNDKKQAFCQHCGTEILIDDEVQHIQYDNAEEVGYKFEKGRQRAQAEAQQVNSQNSVASSSNQKVIKKKRTWLWVLGWICVFPIPLMLLLLRKKDMNQGLKYGIIIVAWIVYFAIGLSGASTEENDGNRSTSNTTPTTGISSTSVEETPVQNVDDPIEENITELSFLRDNDITLKVGESTSESYINVKVKNKNEFASSDVVFLSDNSDIATIEFTKDALTTYLYYKITGVSAGETFVYASTLDGNVVSQKIKIIVEGETQADVTDQVAEANSDDKLSLQDITYVELDDLQRLFCDLSSANTRSDVNDIVKERGLSVHWFQGYHYNAASCYVGMSAAAVSDRPRDREGAVIDIHFLQDGTIEKMGYTTGGSASFFSDFKLTYENGEFHYAGEAFEDGEEAMQLYLANY